jgi:dTDP-4-amino-4,6-dideoxygalactose transaminase
VKLQYLDDWNKKRKKLASVYIRELSNLNVALPVPDYNVFHQFVVRVPQRNEFRQFLSQKAINTDVHYPYLLHDLDLNKGHQFKMDFFHARKANKELISLPMEPTLTKEEVKVVTDAFRQFFDLALN